jgi:hypothetical protein
VPMGKGFSQNPPIAVLGAQQRLQGTACSPAMWAIPRSGCWLGQGHKWVHML